MMETNCKMNRSLNIVFGTIFLLLTFVLIITGIEVFHAMFFLLAAFSFGMALRFYFAQKDITCLFPE